MFCGQRTLRAILIALIEKHVLKMSSRDKIVCGVCDLEMVKKNLSTHFQRRHPGQNINWKLPWARNLGNIFKKSEDSNFKKDQISFKADEHQENVSEINRNRHMIDTQNITESNSQDIYSISSNDCLDERTVKRARYEDEKSEKSIADVLQAVQSKCHKINFYFLFVFVFEFIYVHTVYSRV